MGGESLVTRCMNTIEWKFGLIVWLLEHKANGFPLFVLRAHNLRISVWTTDISEVYS